MDVTLIIVSIICVTVLVCCLIVCKAFGKKEITTDTTDIAKTVVEGILSNISFGPAVNTPEDNKVEEQFNNVLGEVNDLFGGVNDDEDDNTK